jgi:hypothetical protein
MQLACGVHVVGGKRGTSGQRDDISRSRMGANCNRRLRRNGFRSSLLDYPVPKDSLPFIERVRATQKTKLGSLISSHAPAVRQAQLTGAGRVFKSPAETKDS